MVVELGFSCRAVNLEKGEHQVVICFVNHKVTHWCRYREGNTCDEGELCERKVKFLWKEYEFWVLWV